MRGKGYKYESTERFGSNGSLQDGNLVCYSPKICKFVLFKWEMSIRDLCKISVTVLPKKLYIPESSPSQTYYFFNIFNLRLS